MDTFFAYTRQCKRKSFLYIIHLLFNKLFHNYTPGSEADTGTEMLLFIL